MSTNKEIEIGKKAAEMLQYDLRSVVMRFSEHFNRLDGGLQMKDARAVPRFRKSTLIDGTTKKYLRGIATIMVRHGFIQHYGIKSGRQRSHGERIRRKPKETHYSFETHYYKKGMKAKPFLDAVAKYSQAISFLAEELPKVRGEELVLRIKEYLENKT